MKLQHKKGDKMYVHSSYYISNGEDDVDGGLVTIKGFEFSTHLPEGHIIYVMVSFEEIPSTTYNYTMLLEEQDELKKQFGKAIAKPNPDINTPWIEPGDIVNGEVYKGKPIW